MNNGLKTLALIGLMGVAAFGGYRYGMISPSEKYSIIETKSGDVLRANKFNKTYALNVVLDEIYLGDAAHNFAGAKALTIQETLDGMLVDSTYNKAK